MLLKRGHVPKTSLYILKNRYLLVNNFIQTKVTSSPQMSGATLRGSWSQAPNFPSDLSRANPGTIGVFTHLLFWIHPRKLTGQWKIHQVMKFEDVFPTENGGFSNVMLAFRGVIISISLTELLGSLGLKHQRTPSGMVSFQNKPQLAGHVIVGKRPHVGVRRGGGMKAM